MLTLGACELIVDFDPEEAENRQTAPKPIPGLDGARPIVPDAATIPDSTLVRPPTDGGRDAASDAAPEGGSDAATDAASDGGMDASLGDAATDASDLDAQPADGAFDGALDPVVDADFPSDGAVPPDGSESIGDAGPALDVADGGVDAS